MRDLHATSNINYIGKVPFDDVWRIYAEASLLVCTSEYEGFPNTFLEAFSLGIPVVTTFDPDGIIARFELGAYASSANALAESIRVLTRDDQSYEETSKRCKRYFAQNHRVPASLERLEASVLNAKTKGDNQLL